MAIKAGDLRSRITLMRPTEEMERTQSESTRRRGAVYEDACEMPAAVADVSGREFYQAHAVHAEDIVTFTTRFRPDVNTQWRVRHGGTVYNILEVNHLGYMRDWMRMKCRAVKPGGV